MSETYKVAKYENVSDHETRLDTLEGADTIEGSVAKTVKDAVDSVKGTGWNGETVKGNADSIGNISSVLDMFNGEEI